MATLNGARALGLSKEIGSLKKGKQADIVAIDLNQIETIPLYEPLSQIVYAADRRQISNVWVAGKRLLKDRKLTTLKYDELIENTKLWEKKINNNA